MKGSIERNNKGFYLFLYLVSTLLFVIILREISFERKGLHYSFIRESNDKDPLQTYPNENDEKMNFIVVGDWGMNSKLQKLLAKQLANFAQNEKSQFIISTGDNFYYFGVLTEKDPNFLYTFEYSFTDNKNFIQVPWFISLGNHDNRGRSQAQVDYSTISKRWNMPNNYYYQHFPSVGKIPEIHLIVLDTTPIVCPYSTDILPEVVMRAMPECEIYSFALPARELGGWTYWEQVLAWANHNDLIRSQQIRWLNDTMKEIKDKEGWKIVIGHHSMESACLVHGSVIRDPSFRSLLAEGNVDLYFSGHDHTLQHIKIEGERFHHVVAGGGGFMTGYSAFHAVDSKFKGLKYGETTFGFISASLSSSSVVLDFIDYRGRLLYSTTITRA